MVKIPANKILQFFGANEKIADVNESASGAHICSISTKVPPNCVAILLSADRITGSGTFRIYPNEGTTNVTLSDATDISLIAMSNQRLKWALSVPGDDFDLYMFGYFVEGTVKSA